MANLTLAVGRNRFFLFCLRLNASMHGARCFRENIIAFHLPKVEVDKAKREYHDNRQQRIHVERNGAHEHDKAVAFQKSDVAALTQTLQTLCDRPELVAEYKAGAREFICEKYDWNAVTNKTMELYHENFVDQQVSVS